MFWPSPSRRASRPLATALIAALAGCGGRATQHDRAWAELADPHRHDVNVDGLRLHYVDLGEGEPVVLVHGFGDSSYAWHANATALRDAGFRVVLVDQPGLGRSGIPPGTHVYSIENQAKAVLALATRLGIDRFRVVGHSMGGAIALYLGWRHPGRVLQVVTIAPASFRARCNFGIPGVELLARALGPRWFAARALREVHFHAERVDRTMIDEYARPFEDPARLHVLASLCRDYFSPEFDRMTRSYRELAVPLLIVWGSRDSWIPPAYGARLHELVPGSRLLVVPDAGHAPHQEAPDAVDAVLLEFLRGGARSSNH